MKPVGPGFEIDRAGCQLLRDGRAVPLEPRAIDLLCYLADNPGRLLRKDELLERVWQANALSEAVLSNAIAKLRKALGQAGRSSRPIETVHGRGYRFHPFEQPAPLQPSAAEPFIGRPAVLALLDACLERAAAGTGQCVLVTGEAGIGKTRLLSELAARAEAQQLTLWRGDCQGQGSPAYWCWVEVVRCAAGDPSARALLPAGASAIAQLVPELASERAAPIDAHALRFQLFDELARWFAACARAAPRAIVLDDLQWADPASVDLLSHLAHALSRERVLLVAAARDPGEWLRPQLTRAATHVPLAGLEPAETEQLVRSLARDATADPRSLELLWSKTRGNPFFVRQLVQLLEQRAQPASRENLGRTELPIAVRHVIEEQLANLPPATCAALSAGAVIGYKFRAPALARLVDRELAQLLDLLEPARRRGFVRAEALDPHALEFQHELMRDVLYERMSQLERGAAHARLLQLWAAEPALDDARHLAELAEHALRAVPFDVAACMTHACRAADAARDVSGFEAAAALRQRALTALVGTEASGEQRLALLYELALDLLCSGELRLGKRALEQGVDLALTLGHARWVTQLARRLASWHDVGAAERDPLWVVEQALACQQQDPHPDAGARAVLLARRAELAVGLGAATRGQLFEQAAELAAISGDVAALLDVAIAQVGQRDPCQLAATRRALTSYRTLEREHPHGAPGVVRRMRAVLVEHTEVWCALVSGDLTAADLGILRCEVAAQASHVPQLITLVELQRFARALGDGRLDAAAAAIERLTPSVSAQDGLAMVIPYCTGLLLEARDALPPLDASLDLGALAQLPRTQQLTASSWLLALLARSGQRDLAQRLFDTLPLAELEHAPGAPGDLGLLCNLAEAAALLGQHTHCEWLYARLQPCAACNAVGLIGDYRGSVAHYLGQLALALGQPRQAAAHLRTALAFNEQLGMRLQVPRTAALLAEAS